MVEYNLNPVTTKSWPRMHHVDTLKVVCGGWKKANGKCFATGPATQETDVHRANGRTAQIQL